MKKLFILSYCILMISFTTNACEGITIKGNSGASYCLSKHKMNWHSAYAWCNAQEKQLIDMEKVCSTVTGTCTELKLSTEEQNNITSNGGSVKDVWTNTSYSPEYAYFITLSSGKILSGYSHYRNNQHEYPVYALCQ